MDGLVVAHIEGHGAFCATFEERINAERMAAVHGLEIRDFGVELRTINPQNGNAIDWRPVDGWSTWKREGHTEGHSSDGFPTGDKPEA